MNEPHISVITPCGQQSRFIECTICSVLDQGYDKLEYIMVDAGASDQTVAIVDQYRDDLTAWVSRPHTRAIQAINAGLELASGDLVAVMNAGEIYLPHAIQSLAEAWQQLNEPDWLVGACAQIGDQEMLAARVDASAPASLLSFLMHNSGLLPGSATFLAPAAIKHIGGFDALLDRVYQYEYACRLLANGVRPVILPRVLSARRNTGPMPSALDTVETGLELLNVAERYAHLLPRSQRPQLWSNLDRRRRIYSLARAKIAGAHAKRFMLNELMRRPWWLLDDAIRKTLVHGVARPMPTELLRPAA